MYILKNKTLLQPRYTIAFVLYDYSSHAILTIAATLYHYSSYAIRLLQPRYTNNYYFTITLLLILLLYY